MYAIDQPRSCRCLVYLTVFIIIIILNLLDNIVRNIRLHCNKFHPHCNVFCFSFDYRNITWLQQLKHSSRNPLESVKPAASFLEACDLLFEKELLSNHRINSLRSPAIGNIEKGMAFFEKWCHSNEETGNFRHSVLDLLMLHTMFYINRLYVSWFILFPFVLRYGNVHQWEIKI